jgi:cell division protein FtsL
MAKKRLAPKGRVWVALILLAFLVVTAGVIQRRVFGMRQANEIMVLQRELQAAESRKLKLESEIDSEKSLLRIGQVARQKLGMRGPEETPTVMLRRSGGQ